MSSRLPGSADVALTALAPVIWGTTYLVTTELLPTGRPLMDSLVRALPAGLLLLAWTRALPHGIWIARAFVLGALNFSLFWWLLFVSAYRLPGGVAATLNAMQPLMVLPLSFLLLGARARPASVIAGFGGLVGVALLMLRPGAAFDGLGVAAGFGGAASMAAGTVLAKRWQPPVDALTFTAWQLVAGGLLLLPFVLLVNSAPPRLTLGAAAAYVWLGLFGAALSYVLWFRGVARLGPAAASPLVLLSPLTAVLLGWIGAGQSLSPVQIVGIALVMLSVWLSQRASAPRSAPPPVRAGTPA